MPFVSHLDSNEMLPVLPPSSLGCTWWPESGVTSTIALPLMYVPNSPSLSPGDNGLAHLIIPPPTQFDPQSSAGSPPSLPWHGSQKLCCELERCKKATDHASPQEV